MRIIDLSHALYEGMPVYEGHGPMHLFQNRHLDVDHFNAYRLESGLHVGTHIDAPSHLSTSPLTAADMALSNFIGRGVLVDVRGRETITKDALDGIEVPEGGVVLLFSGMDESFYTDAYYTQYPAVQECFMQALIEKNICMLGMDMFAPDRYPFKVHKMCFDHNIAVLENMTNLSALVGLADFTVCALPLKIRAEASPVRAIAIV